MNAESEKDLDTIKSVLRRCVPEEENLIGILLEVQNELGYVPPEAMKEIAAFLDISETKVWSVATFYNEFRFIPRGKHHLKVCLGTACHIKSGRIIMQAWERKLSISEGEVTDDRRFSLDRVGCVGCCSMAPVTVLDDDIHGNMSPTKVDGMLLKLDLVEKA
ncbi:MAG: NAD(P)H-dependent oxidoreductase subunit E [Pseudomonadota bacterium]